MKRQLILVLTLCSMLLFAATSMTQAESFGVDFFAGTSFHSSIPVQIGEYRINDPEWETRPFGDAMYFSARIRWAGHEVEFIHDKVYLGKDTDEIKDFSVSDGYNLFLYNLPQNFGPLEVRLGLGVVVAHPEGTIDGYDIGSLGSPSWRVGSIGGQVAAGYRSELWEGISWMVEGKVTTGFLHATYPEPVNQINIPVTGTHILFGIGYDL